MALKHCKIYYIFGNVNKYNNCMPQKLNDSRDQHNKISYSCKTCR